MTATLETPTLTPEQKPVAQLDSADITPIKIRKKRAPKHDFKDGAGRVFAHKHDNGGGWVADTAKVEDRVYVGPRSEIFQHAKVSDGVRLEGQAKIFGHARVRDSVLLRQNSAIFGTAYVCDATTLGGAARVSGNAHVSGTSRIDHRAIVSDSARVVASTLLNDVRVTGGAMVMRSHLALEVKAYGNCFISYSTLYGDIEVFDFCQCLNLRATVRKRGSDDPSAHFGGHALLADNCHINQNIRVQEHAVLIRVVLYDPGGDRGERPDIGDNMVLSYATFQNPVALRDHLTQLRAAGRAGMPGVTRPPPPPQQPGAQRPNYLAEIARNGRRIMTLQESDA